MKSTQEGQDDDGSQKRTHHKTTGLDKEEEEDGTEIDEDSPPPRKRGVPDIKKSSLATTSSCSTSTAATAPASPATVAASLVGPPNSTTLVKRDDHANASLSDDIDHQRQSLLRETILLFLLSAVSFAVFLCLYLPMGALVALAIFVVTTCLAFVGIYRRLLLEYENLLRGRGIGDYLPTGLYTQLAETTLHEWMSDSSFYMEYRPLLLYYVPGITTEQLEAMVDRLSPHHQEMLRRRGLGQFFGDGFMRLIMGDTRWTPQQQHEQTDQLRLEQQPNDDSTELVVAVRRLSPDGSPPVRSITAAPLSRNLYDNSEDEPSEIGSAGQEETNAENQVGEAFERDLDMEGQLLTDAMYEMVQSYTSSFLTSSSQALSQLAVQAVEYMSPWVIRLGMGVTTASAGVGLLGVWYGAYYPWRSTRVTPRFPSERMLLSTAVLGGATAGMMIMIRRGVRRRLEPAKPTAGETRDTKDDKEKHDISCE